MHRLIPLALVTLLITGCTTSRYGQLRGRSREVGRALNQEREAALGLPAGSPSARSRLDHLTSMRLSLSAVNMALSAVRHLVEPEIRPVAYDTIEEAYDTIEWNIPLGPGEPTRSLPAAFRGGRFDVDQLTEPAPSR
ncbi:MAG: hypothetical protein K8E66_03375 [Phycisphaerales bacterium]|nr:hypothetical protein [Phycisphaerales bacterium]